MKTFTCLIVGALALSAESLRTDKISHECVFDSGCYKMDKCNWSAKPSSLFSTNKGKYYPECSLGTCKCNRCSDD